MCMYMYFTIIDIGFMLPEMGKIKEQEGKVGSFILGISIHCIKPENSFKWVTNSFLFSFLFSFSFFLFKLHPMLDSATHNLRHAG